MTQLTEILYAVARMFQLPEATVVYLSSKATKILNKCHLILKI